MRGALPHQPAAEIGPTALIDLGLSDEELQALRSGGWVRRTVRGRQSQIFDLVYRTRGRQRRRYLGTDEALANTIRAALSEWQRARTSRLERQRAVREAGQQIRATKYRLSEPLLAAGYHFHGRQIRKFRTAMSGNPNAAADVSKNVSTRVTGGDL
jgi:hypothetical protein